MFVTYQGDERHPDDTRPFPIPGLPAPLVLNEPYEITDAFAKSHFNVTAKALATRFCDRYNRSYQTPRLTASDTASPKTADKPQKQRRTAKPRTPKPRTDQTPPPSTDTPPEPAKE